MRVKSTSIYLWGSSKQPDIKNVQMQTMELGKQVRDGGTDARTGLQLQIAALLDYEA